MKIEFSKKLLILDYLVLPVLIACMLLFPGIDFSMVTCAWIAQLGVSTGAYYWKSKNENRVKVPIHVISSLPPEVRDQVDLTTIITSIIQSD